MENKKQLEEKIERLEKEIESTGRTFTRLVHERDFNLATVRLRESEINILKSEIESLNKRITELL